MNKKKYLSLKEIQNEELEMLKLLVDFLEKNNLNYYMWAGTFLGAVRHKGFIPWDDDIDLVMTRPEYNKFLEILKKNDCKISNNLYGECFELNNSNFPFLKIVNKNIEIEEEQKCDKYLWIDIFPLDGTPKENSKYYKKTMSYRKLVDMITLDQEYLKKITNSSIKMFFKKIMIVFLKLVTLERILKKYLTFCTKYNYDKCDYLHNNVWASTSHVYHKDKFENAEYEFENLKINGLKDYDYFLSTYGDYMKLPPLEKRETHSFKAWRVK